MLNILSQITLKVKFLRNEEQHCLLPSLVEDFTCVHYSLTSCQLYLLVPLSSFLAHLLALSHIYIYIYIYMSMISEWRQQSKSTGLWQYQTFRHGPTYWTASCVLCSRNTSFLHTSLFGGATWWHAVSLFGMADWLNRLGAFIIYTVFLIKQKKCKKSSVASAASSVVLHGLPLRSRSLRA